MINDAYIANCINKALEQNKNDNYRTTCKEEDLMIQKIITEWREEDLMIQKMNEQYCASNIGKVCSKKKVKKDSSDNFYSTNRDYSDAEFDLYF